MESKIIQGEELHKKISQLQEVQIDVNNWKTYYIDDVTNEKWVEEHQYPEMQAGGPPQLRLIQKFPWE